MKDVPDLDLPPRRASKGAIVPSAAVPGPPDAEAGRSSLRDLSVAAETTFDDEGEFALGSAQSAVPGKVFGASRPLEFSGGSLELDLGNGPPLVSDSGTTRTAVSDGAGGSNSPLTVLGRSPPARAGETAPVAEGQIVPRILLDPYEARAVADYGEVPDAWWKTPLYAYRVLRRRPELREIAEQKTQDAERARRAAEEALLSFAEVVRYDAEKLGAYDEVLQAVRVAEQVLGQRDAVLAAETDAHKHRQAESNAKLAELEAQLSRIQIEERQVAEELAEAGALLKRAEAHVKRIEAEMRAAIAQAEQGTRFGAARGSGQ